MGYRPTVSTSDSSNIFSKSGGEQQSTSSRPSNTEVTLREAAINFSTNRAQNMCAGARNSRYLLHRSQTDPQQPQHQWASVLSTIGNVDSNTNNSRMPFRNINNAKFPGTSLTRSISDSIVTQPILVGIETMSLDRGSDSSLEQQFTINSESSNKHPGSASKKCYKRLSSAVSNVTIPSIPEQAEAIIMSEDSAIGTPSTRGTLAEYFQQYNSIDSSTSLFESATNESASWIQSSSESSLSNSMPMLIRSNSVSPAIGNIGIRRLLPFAAGETYQCSTPPSANHSAARRIAFQEQRSSSAFTRSTLHSCENRASVYERPLVSSSNDSRPQLIAQTSCASDDEPFACVSRYRVLEYLHCGRTEIACDGSQLCANKIAYLVNLTGFGLPKRRQQACKCSQPRFHKLKELNDVDLSKALPIKAIFSRFERVNAFVAAARSKGMQIFFFDNDNESSQAMAIQYVMCYHRVSFTYACTHLERHCGARLRLSPFLIHALEEWEDKLNPRTTATLQRQTATTSSNDTQTE